MKNNYRQTHIALAIVVCVSFFVLNGCGSAASVGKLNTPSGRPEITIPNSNVQTVMDGIASWIAAQGKTISGSGIYTISASFTKRASNNGIFYGMLPFESTYTIVQNGANVEIYEKTVNMTENGGEQTEQSDYDDMQKELMQIGEFIKSR